MKIFIASDIHGSAKYCRQMLEAFEKEGAERMLLLGDILYHGPRNDLPEEYSPKQVISLLSPYRDRIIAVRGNCDADVDLMVLGWDMPYTRVIELDGRRVGIYHGHTEPPEVGEGGVLISGHTHIPVLREENGLLYVNPGSVSIPKGGSEHGYALYDGGRFILKSLQM